MPGWPTAGDPPTCTALLKQQPEDFVVDELLDLALSGSGEFLWLKVSKRSVNTADVARLLAKSAGLPARAVSYSGLKDRHALATQWFSLHLPGQPDPELPSRLSPEVEILERMRHGRKLRRGTHRGNRFSICLRECRIDAGDLRHRCEQIERRGVPNYFGAQRFGRRGDNLRQVLQWYGGQRRRRPGRQLEGMLHSSARAFLFNQVLAERVLDGSWHTGRDDDIWMLAGTRSVFGPEPLTEDLVRRCKAGDIAPTGPLYGGSASHSWPDREQAVLRRYPELTAGLDAAGARPARRRLALRPANFGWEQGAAHLTLEFELERGEFATALIRELVRTEAE